MGNLIKNERTKLYRKPSTWILMGIIVGLTLIGLVLSKLMFSVENIYSWQDNYKSMLEHYTMMAREDPEDIDAKIQSESYQYLLEHEIPPSDWRTDVANEYFSLKYAGYDTEGKPVTPEAGAPAEPDTETEMRMETLKTILDGNDWKAYVRLQIDDLEERRGDPSISRDELQVSIDILNLYLDMNIVPSAQNVYLADQTEVWKSQQVESIKSNKLSLLRGETENGALLTRSQRASTEQAIDVSLERLATDTPPVSASSFLGLLEGTVSSLELTTLLLIVLAGGIISSEFSAGTVKLLLITPHRRKKIFWSKAVILLEISLIAVGAVFLLSFLISGLFTGFQGMGDSQVMTLFGRVCRFPYLLYIVMRVVLMMLPMLAYGSLALMLSAVTRKSGAAIAVTLLLMFGSEIVMSLVSAFTAYNGGGAIPGIKFLFFANTSLGYYLPSASSSAMGVNALLTQMPDATMTLGFSVVILLIYTVCFLWIARDSFCRRDIK